MATIKSVASTKGTFSGGGSWLGEPCLQVLVLGSWGKDETWQTFDLDDQAMPVRSVLHRLLKGALEAKVSQQEWQHNRLCTAGLTLRYTLGLLHNYCCRGPIWNLRPVLGSSSKTTRGMLLRLFVKSQNMPVWLHSHRVLVLSRIF